jgi:arsenate reductase (thioredoxin)
MRAEKPTLPNTGRMGHPQMLGMWVQVEVEVEPLCNAMAVKNESLSQLRRTRVLFICVGNSCRSPMAEALARHHASDVIDAQSAGISPLGRVADATRRVLVERGVAAGELSSKGIGAAVLISVDLIVNMSGIPGASLFTGSAYEDWDVEDPYGEDMETYQRICEDIESRVLELAARLRQSNAKAHRKDAEDAE